MFFLKSHVLTGVKCIKYVRSLKGPKYRISHTHTHGNYGKKQLKATYKHSHRIVNYFHTHKLHYITSPIKNPRVVLFMYPHLCSSRGLECALTSLYFPSPRAKPLTSNITPRKHIPLKRSVDFLLSGFAIWRHFHSLAARLCRSNPFFFFLKLQSWSTNQV